MARTTPRLQVRTPFRAPDTERDYAVGDEITDATAVKHALAEHPGAVIRLDPDTTPSAAKG